MKRNVGTIDRVIRILIGLAGLSFSLIGGTKWGISASCPCSQGLLDGVRPIVF